jgi:hypothetical protein
MNINETGKDEYSAKKYTSAQKYLDGFFVEEREGWKGYACTFLPFITAGFVAK